MILRRDDAFKIVFNLRTPLTGGSWNVGTGMFIHKSNDEIFLVTASHVAKEINSGTIVVFGDKDSNCIQVPLVKFNSTLNWKHHEVADLACLKVALNRENITYLEGHFLPMDHLNLTSTCVSRDCELTAIGFPNGLGVHGKFSPLTFRSYASSSFMTLQRADTKTPSDFFCLENPSIGGYSGGPVFDLGYMVVGAMTNTKERTICHGFMHGTMSDNTGGKIALVTPAYYLSTLL